MTPAVTRVGCSRCELGEGAYWSAASQCLYWVDIFGCLILRLDPNTGDEQSWRVPSYIGCVFDNPNGKGGLVAALQDGIYAVELADDALDAHCKFLVNPEHSIVGNRFNDGGIDPNGCLWVGSMDMAESVDSGSWWRISRNGIALRVRDGFRVTNGPAFDIERNWVYLTDSYRRQVFRGRYDAVVGVVDVALWKTFGENDGYPDGMNFDQDGVLWIAFWDGSCVRGFDADGNLVQEIAVPAKRPTKIAFSPSGVGYVTSASRDLSGNGADGSLFQILLHR
jgi:xylono-1,5-lactonase